MTYRRLLTAAILTILGAVRPASAQMRVVDWNIAQIQGVSADMQGVFAAFSTDDKDGFAVPPALYVFEEVLSTNVTPLLNMINAAAPPGVTYALGTYTNFGNEDSASGAEAMIYRTNPPLLTEDTSGHLDIFIPGGGGRYTDRYKMKLAGYTSPNALFYIYVTHLKAGTAAQDNTDRLNGATGIRSNADSLGAGTRIIYAGDFNVYSNTDTPYLKFLSAGNGQAVDPLGTGSWAGSSFGIKHTQSPCTSCVPGLVGGGLDDRFDFQLSTQSFQNGTGLSIMNVASAYRSFGNDGNHYNLAINSGNNTYYPADIPRSNALANLLVDASDHLPLVVDYQIPAFMTATLPTDFGKVIQGAAFNVTLQVSNTASVVVSNGADTLAFSAVGTGAVSGLGSGSVQALQPPASRDFGVDTSTVGTVNGSVQVSSSSNGVQPSFIEDFTTGTIVRHSSGSYDSGSSLTSITVSNSYTPNTGLQTINVPIYNYGYDSLQALLNVNGIGLVGGDPGFAFTGGLASGIGSGSTTLTFTFDTTGASGVNTDYLTVLISDENLPGSTTGLLTLTLVANLPWLAGDVNCDHAVSSPDVDTLVNVLLGIDTNPCHVANADVNGSGAADGNDISAFVSAFLGS